MFVDVADTSFVVGKAEAAGGAARTGFPFDYTDYRGSDSPTTASGLDLAGDFGEPAPFGYDYSAQGEGGGGGGAAAAGEQVLAVDAGFNYDKYVGARKLRGGSSTAGGEDDDEPFGYDYKAPSSGSGTAASTTARGVGTGATTTVFFHEEAVRVGERLLFYFPAATTSALGFCRARRGLHPVHGGRAAGRPRAAWRRAGHRRGGRHEGDAAHVRVADLAGESKFCATSLEALVEGAMAALGTRDIAALASTLPAAARRCRRTPSAPCSPSRAPASWRATTRRTRTPCTAATPPARPELTWWRWKATAAAMAARR